jgi:hypothetical protein
MNAAGALTTTSTAWLIACMGCSCGCSPNLPATWLLPLMLGTAAPTCSGQNAACSQPALRAKYIFAQAREGHDYRTLMDRVNLESQRILEAICCACYSVVEYEEQRGWRKGYAIVRPSALPTAYILRATHAGGGTG